MPETETEKKISRLAARRQVLWAKAPALTAVERLELVKLSTDLDALWEQHRMELARPQLVLPRRPLRAYADSSRTKPAA